MNRFTWTLAHYAAVVSTVAIVLSGGSLYVAKRALDLSLIRDQRELQDKKPAIDLQLRPTGVSTLSVTVEIINRSDINIVPLDIVAEHSFEAGDLYLSNAQQSTDKLSSSLSLRSMGTIAPKGRATAKATLAGVTDGKFEQFRPGLELEFTVRVRFADQQDTVEETTIVRRILSQSADNLRPRPTPEMFLNAVLEAKREARNRQLLIYAAQIFAALVVALALLFCLLRFWPAIALKLGRKTPSSGEGSEAKT